MRHRRPEGAPVADLVLNTFVQHHERVGGRTDTDDQTGDTGQVQGVANEPAEQHQGTVHQHFGQHQRHQGDQAENPVEKQGEQCHQCETDQAREQAGLE